MYRHLPQRCNLEHLRKEAKAVQRTFGDKRGWRLTDAQHAVARGYGFASWSKLKAHVESVSPASRSDTESAHDGPRHPELRGIGRPRHGTYRPAAGERLAHSIAGTWVSDREKSGAADASQNQDAMLSVSVAGDTITLTQVTLGMPGHEVAMKMAIRADGREHPIDPGSPDVLHARWIDARGLEATVKRGDGTVVRGQYEVSEDGATLTVSTANYIVVFQRA